MLLHLLLSLSLALGTLAETSFAAEDVELNSASMQGKNSTRVTVPVKGNEAPSVYFSEDAQKKTFATGASANALTDQSGPAVVLDESLSGGRDLAIAACAKGGEYSDKCLEAVLRSKYIDVVPSLACGMVNQSLLRFQCYRAIVNKKYLGKDVTDCMESSFAQMVQCLSERGRPIVTVTEVHELKNQEITVVNGIVLIRKAITMDGQPRDVRISPNRDKNLWAESKPAPSPALPQKESAAHSAR